MCIQLEQQVQEKTKKKLNGVKMKIEWEKILNTYTKVDEVSDVNREENKNKSK